MPNYTATVNCVETVPIYAPLQYLHVEVTGYKPLCNGVPLVTLSVNPSIRKMVCDSQHSSNVKTKYIYENYLDIT